MYHHWLIVSYNTTSAKNAKNMYRVPYDVSCTFSFNLVCVKIKCARNPDARKLNTQTIDLKKVDVHDTS